ncbi:MAG TPA: DUF456 domain-containing protein [Longimicrobiaceae bacterium]|nr:DUF456 domain-containing protein [Longimicrobiaceae bacterium]
MLYVALVVLQVVGLCLIPFGLPGLWLQIAALVAYGAATDFATVGWVAIGVAVVLALAAEGLEFWLGGHFARRYGGSRAAGWGAILGGIAGAVAGVPIPVVGSIVGSFVGSFAGAVLFELLWMRRQGVGMRPALRTGWGALLGRLAATAAKAGIGVAVAVLALFSALA